MSNASHEISEETRDKVLAWQYQDASRLLLSPEQALKEMELEEFEKKSEEEKRRIFEEKNKELLNKVKKVGEIKEFISRILKDNGLSEDEIDFTLKLKTEIASEYLAMTGKGKDKVAPRLHSGTKNLDQDTLSQLQSWQKLYKEEFNIDISKDTETLHIPDKPFDSAQGRQDFNWLIITIKSLNLSTIYNKLKEKFNCYKYWDNLDKIETVADRPDTDIYAIWVRDRIEADEELKNLSANQIQEEGINPITLKERLLLEFFYWNNNKKHLDLNNWTLAAGSRDPLGRVPLVGWGGADRKLYVSWCDASDARGGLRCRQVVF